jgi:hypothetical protein
MAKKPLAENELYKAAPLLKVLEGKEYHPEDNVLKIIEEVAKLKEAVVYSTKGSLKFVGEIDGEELVIDINMTDLHKRWIQLFIKATVGDLVQTFEDDDIGLTCRFPHFMEIVRAMPYVKKGKPVPEGVVIPLELWADHIDEGKQFFKEMEEMGFRVNRHDLYDHDAKYWFDIPFKRTCAWEVIPFLEYSENIDHFINPYRDYDLHIRSKSGNPAPLFYFDPSSPFVKYANNYKIAMPKEFISEWDYDKPKHPYGVSAADFMAMIKKIVQHNTERIDAIAKEHGGLTWHGIQFSDGLNKLEKPHDFDKLPDADKQRIRDRLNGTKSNRLEEYDKYFRNSPYKAIYEFFKERGTVKPSHDYQYYDCHDITFECEIELEVPKKDRTLTKKKVTLSGYIEDFYTDEFSRENGAEIKINLPFHYATDKGKFPSWAAAIKAGSNIKYGGSCNVGATKSAYELKEGDRYGYAMRLTKTDLKPIEDIIFNIESDNQKFLKDCHYKD